MRDWTDTFQTYLSVYNFSPFIVIVKALWKKKNLSSQNTCVVYIGGIFFTITLLMKKNIRALIQTQFDPFCNDYSLILFNCL